MDLGQESGWHLNHPPWWSNLVELSRPWAKSAIDQSAFMLNKKLGCKHCPKQFRCGVPAKARAGAVRIHGSIHTIKNIITSLNIINLKFTWMKTISQTKTIPFQMEHSYCKNMWNSKESQHFEFGKIESFLFGWKKPAHLYPMERRLSSRRIGKLFSQNWANLLRWIQNLKKEQLLDIFVFFPPSNGAGEGSSQLAKWFLACQNYLNACPDSLWHFLQDVEACPDDLTKFPYIAFV